MTRWWLVVTCLTSFVAMSTSAGTRPNIVVIVADDLGWNDVSFHGSNQIPTKNIDALAYEGIILNSYYVSPICTPTRGALMSGKHPIHTGLQHSVIYASEKYGLPLKEKIMPQWFKELGYRTHMVGKWHLGMFAEQYLPTLRGFESHYGYYQGCEDYYDHTYEANLKYWGLDWRRNLTVIRNERDKYSTDMFTKEAVKIITDHNKSEPLFLYLPHQAVHSGNVDGDPLQAPQHYVDRTNIKNFYRKMFAGMVAALDDSVGAVVETLKQRGMMDNTIILFTTDNGGPANGFDANAANNFPLRGVKATLWEGGVRGVGFISSPLLKEKAYVSNHMIHVTDWLPTLYKAAGGNTAIMKELDGYNAWEALSNKEPTKRQEILHNIDPKGRGGHSALRSGDYKLLVGDVGMAWSDWYPPWQTPADSILLHVNNTGKLQYTQTNIYKSNGGYDLTKPDLSSLIGEFSESQTAVFDRVKASYYHNGKPVTVNCGKKPFDASTNCNPVKSPCLFHIPSDPCEYHNIADQNKDLVIELLMKLMQYQDTMVPPLNTPVDPAGNPSKHNGTWVPWVTL